MTTPSGWKLSFMLFATGTGGVRAIGELVDDLEGRKPASIESRNRMAAALRVLLEGLALEGKNVDSALREFGKALGIKKTTKRRKSVRAVQGLFWPLLERIFQGIQDGHSERGMIETIGGEYPSLDLAELKKHWREFQASYQRLIENTRPPAGVSDPEGIKQIERVNRFLAENNIDPESVSYVEALEAMHRAGR